jgi:vitamin B12 transporter
MRHHDTRWITRLLAASCLGTALLATPNIGAAQEEQSSLMPSKDELLMFWDEKELYVQTATRSEKPINQVVENMTVITAKDIEAMNANSVSQILARVPGLFVNSQLNDFNSSSMMQIQGSEARHDTVLLDGMPINLPAEGSAETTFIPVRIIERIEIIKGAASSAWGSALGGVVNIITRSTGDNNTPNGSIGASWGKNSSRNFDADLRGKNGPVGYYLYAGQQGSDGLVNSRDFQRSSVFGKFFLTPNRDLDITVSGGYSDPYQNMGDLPALGVRGTAPMRYHFVNGTIEYRATPELTVRGGAFQFKRDSALPFFFLSDGSLMMQGAYDEENVGGNLRATWSSGINTLTVGVEANRSTLDQTTTIGPLFQSFGYPAAIINSSANNRYGLFGNDTIEFGSLAVTPGFRYDHDDIIGSFYSPSIGLTYELGEHTVARTSVARGFTSPPLGWSKGKGFNFTGNPDIKSEYGWSYQAGLESGIADLVNLKGTLFYNDTRNGISLEKVAGVKTVFNRQDVIRKGYELEADTLPFYNVSLKLGHAYSRTTWDTAQPGYAGPSYDTYSVLAGIKYDDRHSITALLSTTFVYWNYDISQGSEDTTFIWDLTATKKFRLDDWNSLETFVTVHNIFSGNNYSSSTYPNPGRWVEGGLRLKF